MKSKEILAQATRDKAQALFAAIATGEQEQINAAIGDFSNAIIENVIASVPVPTANTQAAVKASRGIKMFTDEETKFYDKFIEAYKATDFKNAIDNIDVAFPETIIEDVFRDIREQHPLLDAIDFRNVSILTKWIISDHSTPLAVWGAINGEITEEIEGSLQLIDLTFGKLSAFGLIPQDMVELGPVFVDSYMRTLLAEGIANGLEGGVINGKGAGGEPIGMVRDIHSGVSHSDVDGYPMKEAVALTEISPAAYGELCATLAKTETGRNRAIPVVDFICNNNDYLTKVMPATTALALDGSYKHDLFPYATNVIISNAVADGKALIGISKNYFMGLGKTKDGTITASDEAKFLEDERAYKVKFHGNGRAYDNTCFILLDISNLAPVYIPVTVKGTVTSAPVTVEGIVTSTPALFNVSLTVAPEASATVTIVDANNVSVGACTVDTETGEVTIPQLATGAYTATIAATGYTSQTVNFNVRNADVVLADVTLVAAG